nr:hypothetical protein [uncultured Dyadobacter sp.]
MRYPKNPLLSLLIISFLGSLPPGIINLRTGTYLLDNRLTEAAAYSSGAVLSEMFLVTTLIMVKDLLKPERYRNSNLWIAGAILMVCITVISVLDTSYQLPNRPGYSSIAVPAVSGFVMNLFNPFQLPFWVAWILVLNPSGTQRPPRIITALLQGATAALGTLLALGLYGYTAHLVPDISQENRQTLRTLSAFLLVVMAIRPLYKLMPAWQRKITPKG